MKFILIEIFGVLLSLVGSSQHRGLRFEVEKANSPLLKQTQEICIEAWCPNPAFIYADSSATDSARATEYFRDISGYKLRMAPAKYHFVKTVLLASIRRHSGCSPDKRNMPTVVEIQAEDKNMKLFSLTTKELDGVFHEVLQQVNDNRLVMTRQDAEPLKELMNQIWYCNH